MTTEELLSIIKEYVALRDSPLPEILPIPNLPAGFTFSSIEAAEMWSYYVASLETHNRLAKDAKTKRDSDLESIAAKVVDALPMRLRATYIMVGKYKVSAWRRGYQSQLLVEEVKDDKPQHHNAPTVP